MESKDSANTLSLIIDSPQGGKVRAALAADQRAKLLNLLAKKSMNINEIAEALGVTQPTASSHVRVLEEAGLVESEYVSVERGSEKRCWSLYDRVVFETERLDVDSPEKVDEVFMPIGMYSGISAQPTCGLAAEDKLIGFTDESQTFYLPGRYQAELLWFAHGYVEYAFPFGIPPTSKIKSIEFVSEVCSEAPSYNNEYPSDITVWMNGVEVGTWTCPGDFGGQRGKLTPSWWGSSCTQYGSVKVWSVNESGSFVDGVQTGDISVSDLRLIHKHPIMVRIGIKPDAVFCGGLNLFGKRFGNHPHDLILRIKYELKRQSQLDRSVEQLLTSEEVIP